MSKRPSLPVRTGRLSRMSLLTSLAAGMAGGVVSEGLRRWRRGESWDLQQQAFTPGNLNRLSNRLSEMRGAAMKMGQLLSMDAGHLLPPELAHILAGLRNDAHAMPLSQLEPVLTQAWGENWTQQFQRFSYQPIASASIGQVHEAITQQGEHLAIKIQYPGVAASIDSDLDNVATLLRWSRLLPKDLDIDVLLAEAKAQLQLETDYHNEATELQSFTRLLADDNDFILPEIYQPLCHQNILAMSFLPGQPVEQLESAALEQRQKWVRRLFELFFRELLEFNRVQTDPNYANYLIDLDNQRMGLIDFGAVRAYAPQVAEAYRNLFNAVATQNQNSICSAAEELGYFSRDITADQKKTLLELFTMAAEPLTQPGPYDFANSNLPLRLQEAGLKLSLEQNYWHSPPVDALLLHRKLAGLFLLAQRLHVKLDIAEIAAPYLLRTDTQKPS